MRVVAWFSCGAASAVATHLALKKHGAVEIAYCDTGSEHPDNARFLADCERWFGQVVTQIRSSKYADTWQVFTERRYLVGPKGALCTTELKKIPRFAFQRPGDIQVFGYTVEEQDRAARFRDNNVDVTIETPLIDAGLKKADCLEIVRRQGIELPAMYRLGYRNNNCIGCVKGGAGYWNKIRVDFPDVFQRMAGIERDLDASIIRIGRKRVFLDELPVDAGRHDPVEDIGCSLLCLDALDNAS